MEEVSVRGAPRSERGPKEADRAILTYDP
jgi:hypothetical protein